MINSNEEVSKPVRGTRSRGHSRNEHFGATWAVRREIIAGVGLYQDDLIGGGEAIMFDVFTGTRDHVVDEWVLQAFPQWRQWADVIRPRVQQEGAVLPCDIVRVNHGAWGECQYLEMYDIAKRSKVDASQCRVDDRGLWTADNLEFRRMVLKCFRNRRNSE